ncbi:MAG: sigma-70 family RNA polymerase sigma factor [Planctomycetota bacterium]
MSVILRLTDRNRKAVDNRSERALSLRHVESPELARLNWSVAAIPRSGRRVLFRGVPIKMLSTASYRDEPATDASLLRRASEGHEEGWQRLVHIYGPLVYRWIRKCGVQSADAADVMQETLVSVAGALPKFDATCSTASFRGWVWTIAKNKLRDRQRQEAKRRSAEDDGKSGAGSLDEIAFRQFLDESDEPPTEPQADADLVRKRTLDCLQDLFPARAWTMFWRTEIDGADASDVAAELGVSKWAVYKAKARVLQRLKQELAGLE